tara:strand:- start:13651 stop:13950 length:300 start_codon:yes stop_codon:yes gene_type:complete
MKIQEEEIKILREIYKQPKISQRELAKNVNFSLGKLNYCIKALKQKGILKIKNFNKSKNKFRYIYMLTPKGLSYKTKITINFLKIKMNEYEKIKKELSE